LSTLYARCLSAVIAAALCLTAARPAGAAPTTRPATRPAHVRPTGFAADYPNASPLAAYVGKLSDAALDAAANDLNDAQSKAEAAFALVTRYGTPQDVDAFREANFVRRLLTQLKDAPDDTRNDLLAFLRAHPYLAHTLAFAVRDGNDVAGVYRLMDRFRQERPKQVVDFPELAVALCVVRDRPLHRHVNENLVKAADPVAVFDFYVAHERQMFYGIRGMPVELLAYVVDTVASIDELTWAVNKYGGTRDVGGLFFLVKYDTLYYEGKAEKKVDHAPGGYTLWNVLQYGGVCADQAYFATAVGKAIGVPTAWTTGESAEMGHAWVGYLKSNGRSAAWDFDAGRYASYQAVRGNVTDPQTGHGLPDSTVSMLGDLIGTVPLQRQDTVALIDAAESLARADAEAEIPPYPTDLLAAHHGVLGSTTRPAPHARLNDTAGQLDLIEMGLRLFASYPRGWYLVADLAKADRLSDAQKHTWADLTQKLCGQKHTDFALDLLEPMVETVADAGEQDKVWEALFKYVQARPDLAAQVRFHQAKLWEEQHQLPRAGMVYDDVVHRYINAGPFALKALTAEAKILKELDLSQNILLLYATAAKLVAKPDQMPGRAEFVAQSNWYKVREAYANRLAEAGQKDRAEQIRQEDRGSIPVAR
jgi:hypothetical protein